MRSVPGPWTFHLRSEGTKAEKMTYTEATIAPSLIPESAPFSPEQRRWLNDFFDELSALHVLPDGVLADAASRLAANGIDVDGAPWHKPKMPLSERMLLAEGRPMARRMMAAMGQQDCRQCGYNCVRQCGRLARGNADEPVRTGRQGYGADAHRTGRGSGGRDRRV
jgi:hypothetical protein